jgi:hypothetical protein
MDAETRSILKKRAVVDYDPCDGDLHRIQQTVWPTCYTDRDEVTVQDMIEVSAE